MVYFSSSSYRVYLVYLFYVCDHCYGAQSPEGIFLYPQDNTKPTFNYLDTINVTWETYSEGIITPWLMLWLGTSQAPVNQTPVYNRSVTSLSSVLLPLNYGQPFNSSFFRIQQGSASDPILAYTSTPFNIQKNEKALPVTWNLASSVASTSTTSATSHNPATSATPLSTISYSSTTAHTSTTPTSSPSSAPGLIESSTIAVAVCASLTLIALTALCGILVRHCYQARCRPRPPTKKTMLVELTGDFRPVELEAGSVHSRRNEQLPEVSCRPDEKEISIEVTSPSTIGRHSWDYQRC